MSKIFHRNNISLFRTSYTNEQFVNSQLSEFAFIGRSNVGKSSLINSLSGGASLAKISNMPGKTVSVNYFKVGEELFLVDLPGYGFAKLSRSVMVNISKLISDYFSQANNLKVIFILLDARHPIKSSDLDMLEQLAYMQREICIILTKCDKKNIDVKFWEQEFNKMQSEYPLLKNMLFTSSKNNKGISELEKLIIEKNSKCQL